MRRLEPAADDHRYVDTFVTENRGRYLGVVREHRVPRGVAVEVIPQKNGQLEAERRAC